MYVFYASVYARPEGAVEGDQIALAGRRMRALRVDRQALAAARLPVSFEQAVAELSALPRMYCEPDGSFVWTSPQDGPSWQVDGNLYDRDGRLLFVDLKGACPGEAFDRLLLAFGWPQAPVMFQLTREAVLVDEAEFRRLAEAG
jgi:hypothetical protein